MASRKSTPRTGKKKKTRRKVVAKRKGAAAKPVPARRTSWRLPNDVSPDRVDLHVHVDPARGGAFRGEVTTHLLLQRRRRSIELHATDLRISRPRLEAGGELYPGRLILHPERETVEVQFDEAIPAGEASLTLTFSGRLRSDLRGLYDARAGEKRYAITQLEAADARRFFPCLDEPAKKARFKLSVTTARKHTVISNSPVEKVEPLPNRMKTVHFLRTPKLSTYLLALAVGEFACSEATHCGETEIRVWHVPGKEQLTAFALEAARETLGRLESYFDQPYPYEKLDLVAVPDFEAGAMENAGAVFFRETLLLVDPTTVTLEEKRRVAEVICHELAHMWYGDLVTMAWWNDLWLNEAFATWMAFHVVDSWKPEWRMWNNFQHYRNAAMALDALANTHAIYTPVRNPYEATENFDLITYEKGASVVRMLERYLGAEVFRSGVRRYIEQHQESNAKAADLWNALSEASEEEVEPVVRAWIEQPGFPILSLSRRKEKGRTVLEMRQERFSAGAGGKRPRKSGAAALRWPIPWVGSVGVAGSRRTRTVRALLTKARNRVVLEGKPPRFVYGNCEEAGFFRPLHEAEELAFIAEDIDALAPVERMGLLGHQWAIVRAGRSPLEDFLSLAHACSGETDPDVLTTLQGSLAFIDEQIAPEAGAETLEAFRAWILDRFGAQMAELGWSARARESDDTRLRRAAIVSILGGIGRSRPVIEEAERRCRRYLGDRSALEPNLTGPVVHIAARSGGEDLWETFRKASEGSGPPQERRRFLLALGDFPDGDLVKRTQRLLLNDQIPTQEAAFVLARLIQNPLARESTWEFWTRRWTRLRRRMPPMLVTRAIDALPQLQTRRYRREVARFFREHPIPTGERAVKQALERFDLQTEFRERAAPGLLAWLAERL